MLLLQVSTFDRQLEGPSFDSSEVSAFDPVDGGNFAPLMGGTNTHEFLLFLKQLLRLRPLIWLASLDFDWMQQHSLQGKGLHRTRAFAPGTLHAIQHQIWFILTTYRLVCDVR